MKIYNTASGQKEDFIPVEPNKIKMYACGPTVYNYFHIGNARPFIFFDVVRRYFTWCGYDVTYVQNITDIDDKIIDKANEEGVSFSDIANKYITAFYEDTAALGILKPSVQPKATEVMGEMIGMIRKLEKSGFAYEVNGDVYFSVQAVAQYGNLSHKKLDEQQVGARVAENDQKKHPADFTLWKKAKPGEPSWQSPWGDGRPGWHTECVVMSRKYLGDTFDIHGGGIDLVFPHHENENAQAVALTGKPLANFWMHNGFLNVEGEKMSKSLNNFFTARDILTQYDAEAVRFFFLSKHYRTPIDFNREIVEESTTAVQNFFQAFAAIDFLAIRKEDPDYQIAQVEQRQRFKEAMEDDFNTAKAVAVLFELAKLTKNETLPLEDRKRNAHMLYELGSVLGFFQQLDTKLAKPMNELATQLIELFIQYRMEARSNKDWALSDKIRNDLKDLGIELKDSKDSTTWSY